MGNDSGGKQAEQKPSQHPPVTNHLLWALKQAPWSSSQDAARQACWHIMANRQAIQDGHVLAATYVVTLRQHAGILHSCLG